jgi:hypothetical protein
MLQRISGELAIDLGRVRCMERSCTGERPWCAFFENGDCCQLRDFEALRIFEILGEKVTHEDRYKECSCG